MAAPAAEREPPSAVCGVSPSDLVAAIDSRNIAHAEEARSLTREGLGAIREPILFNTLWDYYMRTNSINAAKLLTGVAEHQSGVNSYAKETIFFHLLHSDYSIN